MAFSRVSASQTLKDLTAFILFIYLYGTKNLVAYRIILNRDKLTIVYAFLKCILVYTPASL